MNPTTTRRGLAAGALALAAGLVLAACGGDDASTTTDGGGSKAGGTHPVKTYKGVVSVPNHPKRVVVLDTGELDTALTLGVKPVGATRADVATGFLDYLPKDQVSGIANVGTIAAPNLEKIVELKPDLILTNGLRDEKNYDKLTAIAPTVMAERTGADWKANFQLHADALGRKAEAKKIAADYDEHVAQVVDGLGGKEKAGATDVNLLRFMEGADTRVYGDNSYIGTIFTDVGVGRPAITKKADVSDGLMLEISPEQVDKADADVVFYTSYGDAAKSGESKALDGALWKKMRAVQDGTAFRVDDELWLQGIGYTAADKILDQMAAELG